MVATREVGQGSGGFTVVETVITIIVFALVVTLFLQVFMLMDSQRLSVARLAKANDIAYSNLSKVSSLTGIECAASFDLVRDGTFELTSDLSAQLGAGATQTLIAYPTKNSTNLSDDSNCTVTGGVSEFSNGVAKIVSKVTYRSGLGTQEITRASYVKK